MTAERPRGRRGVLVAAVAAVLIAALGGGIAVGMARSDRSARVGAGIPGTPGTAAPTVPPPTGTGSPTGAPTPTIAPTIAPTPSGTTGVPVPPPAATLQPGGSATIPPGALLRPADLGESAPVATTGSTGVGSLGQTEPNACTGRTAYPTDRDRIAARTAGYSTPSVPESGGTYEAVVRYRPGRAAETLAGMRRVLAACPGGRRDGEWTYRYVLEQQRFAGDDALLIRQRGTLAGTDRVWGPHIAVVRVGDHVITVVTEVGEGVSVADRAVRLARAAAARARCLPATC